MITLEDAKRALHEAVEEKGADYVYPRAGLTCTYAEADGSPSCIVGHVLYKLDPKVYEAVALIESTEESFSVGEIETTIDKDVFADRDVIHFLGAAQARQDHGATWGEAEATALDVIKGED